MGNKSNISQVFLEAIRREMTFLVDEYGFNGPYSDFRPEDQKYVYRVWFTGKSLVLEFVLDWRDQDISCYVVRLQEGRFPEGWAVNAHGQRIRISVWQWIRENGVDQPLFTKVGGLRFDEEIPIRVHDYALMLKAYGRPILEDRAEVVFEV